MEEGGDALEEADREADLLEQMPLPGHPESKKNVETCDIYRKKHTCRCYVLPRFHTRVCASAAWQRLKRFLQTSSWKLVDDHGFLSTKNRNQGGNAL